MKPTFFRRRKNWRNSGLGLASFGTVMSIDRSAFWVPELHELEQLSTNRVCALRCELLRQFPERGDRDSHRTPDRQGRFRGASDVRQGGDSGTGGGFAAMGVEAGHGGGGVAADGFDNGEGGVGLAAEADEGVAVEDACCCKKKGLHFLTGKGGSI